jgi:hypothetical protein
MRMTKIAIAVLSFALAGGVAAGATRQAPHLRIADATPLSVAGTGFASREQVTVAYHADRMWTRRATATANGAFVARFAGVHFQACKTHSLSAVGTKGSKAYFKMPPLSCSPPPDEP